MSLSRENPSRREWFEENVSPNRTDDLSNLKDFIEHAVDSNAPAEALNGWARPFEDNVETQSSVNDNDLKLGETPQPIGKEPYQSNSDERSSDGSLEDGEVNEISLSSGQHHPIRIVENLLSRGSGCNLKKRKARSVDVSEKDKKHNAKTNCIVHARGLPCRVTKDDIKDFFADCGNIKSVDFKSGKGEFTVLREAPLPTQFTSQTT